MRRRTRTLRCACLCLAVAAMLAAASEARADDGYDLPFVAAVRAATSDYRLLLWARDDYVQSTDYVAGVGVMYTDHDRFNPADLSKPTVLIYDEAGRLVACEYQFEDGASVPAAFAAVPASAWFDIPRHLHYNIEIGSTKYYAQAEWPTQDAPTADALKQRGLMPGDATLLFAFVHPKTRAFIVWAWLPNTDGPFAGENALMP
jgi:hypothetical protein